MKRLSRLAILFCTCAALAPALRAGPEPMSSGKEMKEVAPAPVECNWTGFYLGVVVGGQFGHAETVDLAEDEIFDRSYQFNAAGPEPRPWGYNQSGIVAGGTVGYNFQWNWLLLGAEADLGYMNIEGSGPEPESEIYYNGDTVGHSNSDFFTTMRGRVGVAMHDWLFYATGGGIGVNWTTRLKDDCNSFPCGFDEIDARKEEFVWGWTGGGGIERRFGCHWSVKAEYLFYTLPEQHFSGVDLVYTDRYQFEAHDQGHIIRAGLNYKF